ITRASAKSMGHEMIHDREHSQYSLKEGYGALLAHLMKDIKAEFRLSEPVRRIDFSADHVQVFTDSGVYEAEKVLVTVPLPLLPSIEYIPAISDKLHAATKIGFGSVIKVLIRFDHKWWGSIREKQFEKLFFMFSKEIIPTWWTQYPAEHAVLTGWVAGPNAHALRQKSEAEIISLGLESLSNIFTVDLARLREMVVASRAFIWEVDPYAQGGYSYPTPETETAIEDIIAPVNDKLYFAGEALWDEQCATVEGAFQSGRAAAARMMQ
ncbi:MAG: FAD-dependent oxidoreductase, partial [Candidatus Pacebacteria bacterium]|nr:FAD-dependent oxidoreductase [Candidatus Paceibacterota bacterium]